MMFSKHLFKKGSFTLQKSSIEKIEPFSSVQEAAGGKAWGSTS